MGIVDTRNEDLGGSRSDTWDRLQPNDARVRFADRFEFFDDAVHLLRQGIQDRQLDVELAFPKLVGLTFGQRLSERVDPLAAGMPGFVAGVDRDPLVDEPGADGVLGLVDASVEGLTVFHQRSELAVLLGGRMDGLEFSHGGHPRELEGIVLIGLAFDIGPLPGLFIGGADERGASQRLSQVVDPARGPAGFHDDEIAAVFFEDRGEIVAIGGGIEKGMFSRCCVEEAAHGIELAEVESENFHVDRVLVFGGRLNVTGRNDLP